MTMKTKRKKLSKNSIIAREQDFLPIEKIECGIIKQTDGRYVKILEVETAEYSNLTPDMQWAFAENFILTFENSPIDLHIKVKSSVEDVSAFFSNINNEQADDPNKFIQERKKDYIETTKAFVSSTIRKQHYYFIFSYEGNRKNENEIYEEFDRVIGEYLRSLSTICEVVERSYQDNDHPIEVLYSCLNPKSELTEGVQNRYERIMADFETYNFIHDTQKTPSINDIIAPKGLDFTVDTSYMVIDGIYQTFLTVRGNSLPQILPSDFVAYIANHDCEVDIFTQRIPKQKVLSNLKAGEKSKQLTSTANENAVDTTKLEDKYGYFNNLNYIRRALMEDQNYYETVIVLTFKDESLKALKNKVDDFKGEIDQKLHIKFRETFCNAQDLFLMTLPLMYYQSANSEVFRLNSRGLLTSSFISLVPFASKDLKDITGIIWGINLSTHGIYAINTINRNFGFQNSNMAFVGGSGAGKSFLQMLLGSRLYMNGFRVFYVCPIKGHEYQWFANSLNGTFISLLPQMDCINLFEVRPEINNRYINKPIPLLTKKITQIISFLRLSMPTMTNKEQGELNIALMGLYESFGITTDNDSIYDENHNLKTMPIFSDLKNYLVNYPQLKEVRDHIERFISGSWSNLNGQTNVDLTKSCIVINCDENEMEKEYLAPMMYLAIMTLYDIIKTSGTKNDILNIDEVWKALKDEQVSDQIEEMARVIRGYQGGLFVATQDIKAFLDSRVGSIILNLCDTKIIKRMKGGINDPNCEVVKACDALSLSKYVYVDKITKLTQKEALIITPNHSTEIFIYSSYSERHIYGTDDATIARREYLERKKNWGKDTFMVTYDDMVDMINTGLASTKDLE